MSLVLRLFSVLVVLIVFASCSKDSEKVGGELPPPVNQRPLKKLSGCYRESDLMQAGIVGGERVAPYTTDSTKAVMVYFNKGSCTATPIADDVLLLAAHCATGSDDLSLVDDGWVAFHSSISCESGFDLSNSSMVAQIDKYVVHSGYSKQANASQIKDDLALVFLKNKIPSHYPIYKIAKPSDVTSSSSLYLYGFGATGYEQGGSGILRKVEIPNNRFQVSAQYQRVVIDQTAGSGICSGDSGGAGLINVGGELQILGVNSYVTSNEAGTEFCKKYGVMVLADSYRSWIEEKMAANGRYLRQ